MKQGILCLLCLLALASLGTAGAQEGYALETTGTITATLGGQELSWRTVLSKAPGVKVNSANWSFFEAGVMSFHTFMLQAYPPRVKTSMDLYDLEGMLDINFTLFDELPEACPCTVNDAVIVYSTSDSISEDKYKNDGVTLTLSEFRRSGEDTFALAGEFSTTLVYQEDPLAEPDPSNTLDISGSFEATLGRAGNQAKH